MNKQLRVIDSKNENKKKILKKIHSLGKKIVVWGKLRW